MKDGYFPRYFSVFCLFDSLLHERLVSLDVFLASGVAVKNEEKRVVINEVVVSARRGYSVFFGLVRHVKMLSVSVGIVMIPDRGSDG